MASVTLKNVYKIYAGGVTAVTDFCLDIEDKEFIILVGPSGCESRQESATPKAFSIRFAWTSKLPNSSAAAEAFSKRMLFSKLFSFRGGAHPFRARLGKILRRGRLPRGSRFRPPERRHSPPQAPSGPPGNAQSALHPADRPQMLNIASTQLLYHNISIFGHEILNEIFPVCCADSTNAIKYAGASAILRRKSALPRRCFPRRRTRKTHRRRRPPACR